MRERQKAAISDLQIIKDLSMLIGKDCRQLATTDHVITKIAESHGSRRVER